MIYILSVLLLFLLIIGVLQLPVFGASPKGARLERIRKSPHYKNGQFQNLVPTQMMVSGGEKKEKNSSFSLCPKQPLEMVHRDLKHLSAEQNLYVWFGHSSYLLSLQGVTVLVDPTFYSGSPVPFFNKAFAGTEKYTVEDLPEQIDFLLITHDHYDHLDYQSVKQLKQKVRKVICPLGVGAHLERWGYRAEQLIEMDWQEKHTEGEVQIECLPSRHFSGRSLHRNNTLWAAFLLQVHGKSVFIGGDGGYGPHFQQIGETHPKIDCAILENGQYNLHWRYIHTLPQFLGKEAQELHARQVITVHHSKYALARHDWEEPLRNERQAQRDYQLNLLVAKLGEITEIFTD